VDAYYEEVTGKGVVVHAPPKDYKHGLRGFVVEDPDGNLLGFGQEAGG